MLFTSKLHNKIQFFTFPFSLPNTKCSWDFNTLCFSFGKKTYSVCDMCFFALLQKARNKPTNREKKTGKENQARILTELCQQ